MSSKTYHEIEKCRVCGCKKLRDIMSLGIQHIINFPDSESTDKGIRAPLDLVICDNSSCSLVQLRHTVNPELMYREYWYRSGVNKTMRDALLNITSSAQKCVKLGRGDIAVDIGANDGTLLRSYNIEGLLTVGFEPASNLIKFTQEGTYKVINDFFNAPSFREHFNNSQAKVITSIAMFYDLEDPNKFVSDIKSILEQDGVWINQMNYLGTMLEYNAFDNISHEHLEYYSLSSLQYLLNRHNLEVFDVELNDLNGGSIRAYITHKGTQKISSKVAELQETENHLNSLKSYELFVTRITNIRDSLLNFVDTEIAKGKSIYVYGASTRGSTLLQYFNLDSKRISAAAERNPVKWGKKMIGTNIPIISEEDARNANPDYFLVLPWAFINEFKLREKNFLENGGKFIVPLPDFKLI